MKNDKVILTVTQLNEYVKMMLDNSPVLTSVFISGEVSNFTGHSRTGHLYFSLKDSSSSLKAVMFKSSAQKLKFELQNGMTVIAGGRISAYPRDGIYQLYVDSVTPEGAGELFAGYEQLKNKLEAAGLFRAEHKRPLPMYPSKIGVVTSAEGAAVLDIINIAKRRYPACELIIYPSLVQGEQAAEQLVSGIAYFNMRQPTDIIIIGRGGGSAEDLWPFNSELLAYAIYNSRIPVISAVGHERDYTIADFVADLRAPTPSAAAELALPDSNELRATLGGMKNALCACMSAVLTEKKNELKVISSSAVLRSYSNVINEKRLFLDSCSRQLDGRMKLLISKKRGQLAACAAKSDALSPLAVLSRGYAIAQKDGVALHSASQVTVGDVINVRLGKGQINAAVIKTESSDTKDGV